MDLTHLDARAELVNFLHLFFGRYEGKKKIVWDFLTFNPWTPVESANCSKISLSPIFVRIFKSTKKDWCCYKTKVSLHGVRSFLYFVHGFSQTIKNTPTLYNLGLNKLSTKLEILQWNSWNLWNKRFKLNQYYFSPRKSKCSDTFRHSHSNKTKQGLHQDQEWQNDKLLPIRPKYHGQLVPKSTTRWCYVEFSSKTCCQVVL